MTSTSARLGPFGHGVRIRWTPHASERYFLRVFPRLKTLGLGLPDFENAIRLPTVEWSDEPDPKPKRIRRWAPVGGKIYRVVFTVVVDATPSDSGEIQIITVFMEERP